MSRAVSMPAGVSSLPRGAVGRGSARMRAGVRRRQLDAALAQGADPWSAGDLLVRAARLGSWPERRRLAAGIARLLELAAHQWPTSRHLQIRHRVVLENRNSLFALADRLEQPAPVEIAVVARLSLLLSDGSSPVYEGGRDPAALAEVTAECVHAIWSESASD